MVSFQSKIGWKRPRKTENSNRKLKKKIAKKFKKLKNTIMDLFQEEECWKRM